MVPMKAFMPDEVAYNVRRPHPPDLEMAAVSAGLCGASGRRRPDLGR